ncbi:hypothetical protein [Halodurantibacterium flavum]|uniref:DUF21 domain-containing protein n=1 Tax=Halodurantibacterium flavum TaxID=1382802 RepID=A0ABW4S7Q6_9RHOB
MEAWLSDLLTAIGLILTLAGAGWAAWSVILREEDATRIGQSRASGATKEEQLRLPMVQNLLAASRGALIGLVLIATGTALQLLPVLSRLALQIPLDLLFSFP